MTIEPLVLAASIARATGIVAALPLGKVVGHFVRLALIAALVSISPNSSALVLSESGIPIPAFLCLEFVFGFVLAAPVRILVEACQCVGELLDTARGQTIGSVTDPLGSAPPSDLAGLARIAAMTWCLTQGGLEMLAHWYRTSFTDIPIGGGTETALLLLNVELEALGSIGAACFQHLFVWCGGYVLIEIAVGAVGHLAPRLSVVTLNHGAKCALTFLALYSFAGDSLTPYQWRR